MEPVLKILFADDQLELRKLVSSLLGARGVHVSTASNGKEAFEMALKEKFDIFLVDLTMPVMSGFEFLKKVKGIQHLAKTPVVILTGDKRDHTVLNCLKNGASDYIVKPFEIDNLHSRILQITQEHATKRSEPGESQDSPGFKEKKYLLIDSDPRDLHAIEILALNIGIPPQHIIKTDSANQALTQIQEWSPDVILLDPYLPNIEDGFVLIGQLQKHFKDRSLPIIILSQFQIPLRYLHILQINPNDYLLKPTQADMLQAFLERANGLPRFNHRRLGDYLVEEGHISVQQLQQALMFQTQVSCSRLSIGALAMIKGYMTFEDVAGIYPMFELDDEKFLNFAIMGNLLNSDQVEELQNLKRDLSFVLGDVLIQLGFISKPVLDCILKEKQLLPTVVLHKRDLAIATGEALIESIREGKTIEAEKYILSGANINAVSDKGVTPLMMAASMGNIPITQLLLDRGAQLNALSEDRWTALHYASFNNKSEVVSILIMEGAHLDLNDRLGRSAEDLATERGNFDICRLFKATKRD